MKVTKAEFYRWLKRTPKVRLINSLLGPCDKLRTVNKVSDSGRIEFITAEGSYSYLVITPTERIEKTDKGYKVIECEGDKLMAEYEEALGV